MSTQFDTPIVDLDRTDELPVLDVDAYEASLAANDKSPSRTDTWSVLHLRAVDESSDESWDAVPTPAAAKPSPQAEALTTNVEGILRRIAALEAEIVAAHETNATLQKDCEALRAEQAQQERRIEALQSANARLCEDRAQRDEITQRIEQQLCERAESIAALEESLSNEKDNAAQLSQLLASKVQDWEKAGTIIEQRNRTIEDLIREGADLKQRLQEEIAARTDLTARLAVAEQSLHEDHALLLEQDAANWEKDVQLAQAQTQIQSLTEERDALRAASTQLDSHAANLEQKTTELALLLDELGAARAELQRQTELVNETTAELGALREKCSVHEAAILGFEQAIRIRDKKTEDLMTQLQAARDERATMGMQLEKARAREKNLTDQVFSGNNEIALLQEQLAVHTEALATIRRDVSRICGRADSEFEEVQHILEPVEHKGPPIHLTGEVLTVGRTSDNDISIPSTLVSRCHARLLVGPTGVIVEDANSTNGCYVNGEQVRQHLLHDGDVLELGDLRYCLRTRVVRNKRNHDATLRQLSSAPRKTGAGIAN